jgi:hypothetical protein
VVQVVAGSFRMSQAIIVRKMRVVAGGCGLFLGLALKKCQFVIPRICGRAEVGGGCTRYAIENVRARFSTLTN